MHVFLPVSTINITLRPHPSIPKLKHGHVDTNHLRPRIPEHRTRISPPSLPSPWRYPHSQQASTFSQRKKAPITDQTAACAKLSASRTLQDAANVKVTIARAVVSENAHGTTTFWKPRIRAGVMGRRLSATKKLFRGHARRPGLPASQS